MSFPDQPSPQNPPEDTPQPSVDDLRAAFFPVLLARLTPRPWLTQAIIAANVLVFLAMTASGVDILAPDGADALRWGADFGPLSTGGEPWRLFTSMFVHFGIFHIAMNMWALWVIGRFIERCIGTAGLAVVYTLSGLAGSLASIWWHPYGVSAGASGAVFGLMGVLGGLAIRLRAELPLRVFKSLRSSLLMFLLYNVAFGLSVPFINMAAHLGGLAGGFLCGVWIARPLTPLGARQRTRAALAVLVGGLMVLVAAFAMLPRVQDFQGFFGKFDRVGNEVNAVLTQVQSDLDTNRITKDAAARVVENEVLAPWREVRTELQAFQQLPEEWNALRSRVDNYAEAQEEVWKLLVEALRKNDPELDALVEEKGREAKRLGDALTEH